MSISIAGFLVLEILRILSYIAVQRGFLPLYGKPDKSGALNEKKAWLLQSKGLFTKHNKSNLSSYIETGGLRNCVEVFLSELSENNGDKKPRTFKFLFCD